MEKHADSVRRRLGEARPVELPRQHGGDSVRDRLAVKGAAPLNISNSTTPNAQMSARLSTALPRACSGAMYAAVPRIMPSACVIAWRRVSVGELSSDRPRPAGRSSKPAPSLREPEVEDLDGAVGSDLDVGRLEVAMDDALFVGCLQRVGDLARDGERVADRHRPARDERSDRSSPSTSSMTSARTSAPIPPGRGSSRCSDG